MNCDVSVAANLKVCQGEEFYGEIRACVKISVSYRLPRRSYR